MRYTFHPLLPLFIVILLVSIGSCNESDKYDTTTSSDPKIAKLKIPKGFRADHLYSPGENEQGSWVAMTFDDKGRMITSDQYGNLYRLTIPPIGSDTATTKIKVDKLIIQVEGDSSALKMGFAQGLLYAFNSLYVVVNDHDDTSKSKPSGLYRLQDMNGDDQYDKVTQLKYLDGRGEHGPHSIVLSPDKKSMYVIAGNFTRIQEMDAYRSPQAERYIDNIMPLIRDPNGHDNVVNNHGGWIAHIDSTGTYWELVSSGYRNAYDLTFNDAGDMFVYDSDMEWDIGLPWYRPTRICHATSGSEFGWRPGTNKWSASFADNLPPVINVGQGSPTSFFNGHNARFPEKYRNSLFAFDWSFGIIYAVQLSREGASYNAAGEEFLSGSPLPLTDGMIGPDGAMYFLTGGRRLESDLYRVYHKNHEDFDMDEPLKETELNEEHQIRRKLESYHKKSPEAISFAWPYLKHNDRFIRFAARIAVENQPLSEWQQKALNEEDPEIRTQAIIALARQGDSSLKRQLITSLLDIKYSELTANQQSDYLRAMELVLSRMGKPDLSTQSQMAAYLNPHYPAKSNELNSQLSKLLLFIEAPGAIEKTINLMADARDDRSSEKTLIQSTDLILRNPQYGMEIAKMLANVPPSQQTFYATALSQVKSGWTPQLQDKYFRWFNDAFKYEGGNSFMGFINGARVNALQHVDKSRKDYYSRISGDSLIRVAGSRTVKATIQPEGPGRNWTMDEAMKIADSGITNRNFERGKSMYAVSLCGSCHQINGEGGVAGPDLTQLGTRFTYKDMLEAIIEPNKTISDQYGATVFHLKEGGSVLGRLISQDEEKYVISQNPFAPQVTKEILKKDVKSTRVSEVSPMLPGMINRLNPEELKDLLAFLKAGGNKQDTIFKK